MLGEFIAAALPELRAEAESLMVDACTITRAGSPGAIDEDTGIVGSGSATTIYGPDAKCELKPPKVQPNTTTAGETEWSLLAHSLRLPITATGVRVGDAVLMTSVLDPDITARAFTVAAIGRGTHMTARRLVLEEVS